MGRLRGGQIQEFEAWLLQPLSRGGDDAEVRERICSQDCTNAMEHIEKQLREQLRGKQQA